MYQVVYVSTATREYDRDALDLIAGFRDTVMPRGRMSF